MNLNLFGFFSNFKGSVFLRDTYVVLNLFNYSHYVLGRNSLRGIIFFADRFLFILVIVVPKLLIVSSKGGCFIDILDYGRCSILTRFSEVTDDLPQLSLSEKVVIELNGLKFFFFFFVNNKLLIFLSVVL